jgi:HTH-type transcriptional regulator/antitoxin HigA
MINKLIKTENEYSFSLRRIDQLMDSEVGTPEFDELELLSTLVEIYEDENFPIDMPDPISAVKFRMEQLGLNQKGLVPFVGSRSKVSEVLRGKRPLTLAMMRSLHQGLGIPADVLLQEPDASFPENIPDLDWKKFPVGEMAKKGWIQGAGDIKGSAEELIRNLIKEAGGFEAASECLFRRKQSSRENIKNDPYALKAWCLKVMAVANNKPLINKFKHGTVNKSFLREIAKLSYFEKGPKIAKEYLEKNGIHLVTISHLSKTYLDGAAFFMPDGNPVVGLTLRYDRLDNFWFCLLHELAHVWKHLSLEKNYIIFDDMDLRGLQNLSGDEKEEEADKIAQEALIPNRVWRKFDLTVKISAKKIISVAHDEKIHPAIIAGRMRFEKNNYRIFSNLIGNNEVRKQFDLQ